MSEALDRVRAAAEAEDLHTAWTVLRRHAAQLPEVPELAWAWLMLTERDPTGVTREELETILQAWSLEPRLAALAAADLLELVDGRPPDDPVSDDDPALVVLAALRVATQTLDAAQAGDFAEAGYLWNLRGNAARLAGGAFDDEAEEAYRRALACSDAPEGWRFNLGLLYKARGRWEEALAVFSDLQAAGSVRHGDLGDGPAPDQAVLWNLAISATGAGRPGQACAVWKHLGLEAEVGSDKSPRAPGLNRVKLRLSNNLIGQQLRVGADQAAEVHFEHVWAAPLSPVHGVVLTPTLYEVGVDWGDLVLWDGQPLGMVSLGDAQVPHFAALTRLAAGSGRTFRFLARQSRAGQLAALGEALGPLPESRREVQDGGACEPGSFLYVFDEQVRVLCAHCARTGGTHEPGHEDCQLRPPEADALEPASAHAAVDTGALVTGKLATDLDPVGLAALAARLDELLRTEPDLQLASPALYRAVDDQIGARRHAQLWDHLLDDAD